MPRLPINEYAPTSSSAATALGAVGGPRGSAAASVRILIEFATQYNKAAISQLQADILKLEQRRNASRLWEGRFQKTLAASTKELHKLEVRRHKVNLSTLKVKDEITGKDISLTKILGGINSIEEDIVQRIKDGRTVAELKYITSKREALIQEVIAKLKANHQQFDEKALVAAVTLDSAKARQVVDEERVAEQKRRTAALDTQILEREKAIQAIRAAGSQAIQKMTGLLIGMLSYTIVGAAFAVGFQAMQGAIDAVVGSLQDMQDPLRKIREELPKIKDELDELVTEEGLTRLEAATGLFEKFGAAAAAIQLTPEDYVDAGALGQLREELTKLNDLNKLNIDYSTEYNRIIQEYTELIYKAIVREEGLAEAIESRNVQGTAGLRQWIELNLVLPYVTGRMENFAGSAEEAADAMAQLRAQATVEAVESKIESDIAELERARDDFIDAVGRYYENKRSTAETIRDNLIKRAQVTGESKLEGLQDQLASLEVIPSDRTERLKKTLENLGSGESSRTRELAAAIDSLNRSEERRSYLTALSNIVEQRSQVLLEKKLLRAKEEIDVSKYSGKLRQVALDAELDRLARITRFQDRQIQQLELIQRLNTPAERKVGESVQDFIQRRALENRKLLVDTEKFEREGVEDRLKLRQRENDANVELRKLDEQDSETRRKRQLSLHLASLEKQLDASKEADQAALEAHRKRLQERLKASEKADDEDLKRRQDALKDEIEATKDRTKNEIGAIKERYEAYADDLKDREARAKEYYENIWETNIKKAEQGGEKLLKLLDADERAYLRAAIRGATDRADLALIAGRLYGANMSKGALEAQIDALGLDSKASRLMLETANKLISAYRAKLDVFTRDTGQRTNFAEGGVFGLRNSSSLFGSNIRYGEEGQEIGVILSNKVSQALKESGRGPLIGSVAVNSYEDPRRAEYRLRRLVRQEIKNEVRV